jgi:hypothetical protein
MAKERTIKQRLHWFFMKWKVPTRWILWFILGFCWAKFIGMLNPQLSEYDFWIWATLGSIVIVVVSRVVVDMYVNWPSKRQAEEKADL